MQVIAAEVVEKAESLSTFQPSSDALAVIFGNEVEGVLQTSLEMVDRVVAIPMQ